MTREDKVREFLKAAGKGPYDGVPDLSVIDTLVEEFYEFEDEMYAYFNDASGREKLVKEWADLQYVLSQAAVYFEIDADGAFNRVHENNMTKVIGDIRRDTNGKILKPEGYLPPDMSGL